MRSTRGIRWWHSIAIVPSRLLLDSDRALLAGAASYCEQQQQQQQQQDSA